MKTDKKTSRRSWFAGLLRGGLLAVFGAVAVGLLRRGSNGEADCTDPKGHTGCRACLELNDCKRPRALSVKQFLRKEDHEERTS